MTLPLSLALLMALAAVAGVLVSMGLLLLGVVTLLRNKLDKRFDDLEARQDKRFDRLEDGLGKRLDEIEADQKKQFTELKDDMRQVLNAVLGVKQ